MAHGELNPEQQSYLRILFAKAKPKVVPTTKDGKPYLPGIVFDPIIKPDAHAQFVATLVKGAGFAIGTQDDIWQDPQTKELYDVKIVRIRSQSLQAAVPYMPQDVQDAWYAQARAYWASVGGNPADSAVPVMRPHDNQPSDAQIQGEEIIHAVKTQVGKTV